MKSTPIVTGTQIIDGFSFYGQASVPNPMTQGQTVNFILAFGQATIT